jgi:transcriptional regulator with XRE-family HTH domain
MNKPQGLYLRKLRQERGLSAAQVAAALGTGESTIYRVERGGGCTARLLLRYIGLLGGDVQRLMEFQQEEVAA